MDKFYDAGKAKFSATVSYGTDFNVPDQATVKQVSEMDEYLEGLQVNPGGLIADAFERIFNEPFDDGTECPNENEQA